MSGGTRTKKVECHCSKEYNVSETGSTGCFHPQTRGGETCTLLGPLERANLNHWTTYAIVTAAIQTSDIECYTPSSEPSRI
jgi:hypothetical protein